MDSIVLVVIEKFADRFNEIFDYYGWLELECDLFNVNEAFAFA